MALTKSKTLTNNRTKNTPAKASTAKKTMSQRATTKAKKSK